MRSIHSISSSIILCVAVSRLSSSNVGAYTNTATRAIGPGAKTKPIEVAAPKEEAVKAAPKINLFAKKEKTASKPEPKKKPVKAAPKVKAVAKKEKPAPEKKPVVKKAAVKAKPKVVAKKEKLAIKVAPKKEKPAPKKAAAKAKPKVKVVAKKEKLTSKVAPKKKPVTKAAVKATPKTKAAVKATPKVKVVAKKEKLASKVAPKKKPVIKAAVKAKPKAKVFAKKKKSNKFDSNIANNLVKIAPKKRILPPFALKKQAVEKKKSKVIAANGEVLNPITFGLKVVQSKEGQEAAGVLISGGLKLVAATLEEGKTAKVSVPRGLDSKTGEIKTEVVSVGLKELLDGGVFAGKEALQVAGSAYNKLYRGYSEPKNNVKTTAAKISAADIGVLNPITFGLKVVQSKEAQEATGELIGGGLKLVKATLEEGKNSKVSVPRGVDTRTGQVKTKVVSVGPGELLQAGLFAGGEIFDAGKSVYNRLYVTGDVTDSGGGDKSAASSVMTKLKVTSIEAKIDPKTRQILAPAKEAYYVNVGGKRVRVVRNESRFPF